MKLTYNGLGLIQFNCVYLEQTPPRGHLPKKVVDGNTRIMVGSEFVESPIEMDRMHIQTGSSKVARTTLCGEYYGN